MDAILEATIQVLRKVGKERLTTTRVALRADVSVGTLYQYFPNKSALLQAALKRHLNEVTEAVERVCREEKANTLPHMAAALVTHSLNAKMKNAKTSVALYSVSADVDGAKIVQQMEMRCNNAIVEMLAAACEPLTKDPQVVALMLQGRQAGVSRKLLESDAPEEHFAALRQELIFLRARTWQAVLCSQQSERTDTSISTRGPAETELNHFPSFGKLRPERRQSWPAPAARRGIPARASSDSIERSGYGSLRSSSRA